MPTERELSPNECSFAVQLVKDKRACAFIVRTDEREVRFEFPREDLQRLLVLLHHMLQGMREGADGE